MTDEQVKKLIEDIDAGYRTWRQDLEKDNLDDAVITSAERTIKVKDFLKNFDQAIDVLKGRFKPEYAASLGGPLEASRLLGPCARADRGL